MERAWIIVSILCMAVAAFLLLRDNQNAAFVVAAIGAVAWFLGYCAKLRGTIPETPETTDDEDEASEEHDEQQ
jgi:hypothetical protein